MWLVHQQKIGTKSKPIQHDKVSSPHFLSNLVTYYTVWIELYEGYGFHISGNDQAQGGQLFVFAGQIKPLFVSRGPDFSRKCYFKVPKMTFAVHKSNLCQWFSTSKSCRPTWKNIAQLGNLYSFKVLIHHHLLRKTYLSLLMFHIEFNRNPGKVDYVIFLNSETY